MFSEIHDFFEQPHAHARRLLTGLKPLPDDPGLLSDDVLTAAGLLLAAHGLDPNTLELCEKAGAAIRSIAADRELSIGKADTGAKASDDFTALYDLLQVLHTTAPCPAHLEELSAADQRLDMLPDDISAREVRLRDTVRMEIAELRAKVLSDLALFEDALSAWRIACTAAQVVDAHDGASGHEQATLLRMVDWLVHENADTALRALLPLLAARKSDIPSDALNLQLTATLARFYARFGDRHEADIHIANLETGLAAMGCAAPDGGGRALSHWAAVSRRAHPSHTARYNLLNQIIVGWFTIAAHRFEGPDGTEQDRRAMADLSQLVSDMRSYQQQVDAEDAAYLSETAAPSNPDILSPLSVLVTRFHDVMEATSDEEPSEAAQNALLAFARDETVPEDYRGRALLRLGYIALNTGDFPEARQRFLSAGTLSRAGDHPDLTIEALKGVAVAQFAEGQPGVASDTAGLAIQICEEMRSKVTAPYLSSAFMADKFELYVLGINAARHAGDHATMLARVEMMKSPAQKIPPGAIPSHIRADTLAQLRGLKTLRDHATARRRRVAIWQRMMLSELPAPAAFDLTTLQTRLGGDAVALTYFFFGPGVLLACLVTGDTVLAERIALPEDAALFSEIDKVSAAGNFTRGLETVLDRIGQMILPETFHPALLAARKLVVCPHQSLHAVPFSGLPFGGGILLDHLEIAMVPNLTCLQFDASRAQNAGLFAAASETATGMPTPLPEVEPEVRDAARIWGDAGAETTVLLGEAATYERITAPEAQAAMAKAKVLHLGFHGSDVGTSDLMQSPMEAGLYLRDTHLDGLDLSNFDLAAEVVLLMACHAGKRAISARGLATLPTDSIYGLQAALHTAGARSMIGGLWEVDDEAAARIAADLHIHLSQGQTPAAALRTALLTYRKTAGPIRDGVAFWGAISLVAFGPGALGL